MTLRAVVVPIVLLTLVGCTAAVEPDPEVTPVVSAAPEPLEPPPSASLVVTGEEEVVFDWSADACEPENIPDLASRALRGSDGNVQLLLSHYVGYRMTGADLDSLNMDCSALWGSDFDADPGQYDDATWISSLHTTDSETIYAIAHHEYRGHTHAGQCPSGEYFDCLNTSLTLYVSTDGGDSYAPAVEPPAHYVAGMPEAYDTLGAPFGLRSPSNIVTGPDGALYMFANALRFGTQEQVMCLLRTENIADPTSWRWWDGNEFAGEFSDPEIDASGTPCRAVAPNRIGAQLTESLTYNVELESYVLVGLSADQIDGREVWGFYVSFSRDLTTWSPRRLIVEMPLPWTVADGGSSLSVLYPTLIDSDSSDATFGTTDMTAHLYYTRHNAGQSSLDRDLVRVPVEFVLD